MFHLKHHLRKKKIPWLEDLNASRKGGAFWITRQHDWWVINGTLFVLIDWLSCITCQQYHGPLDCHCSCSVFVMILILQSVWFVVIFPEASEVRVCCCMLESALHSPAVCSVKSSVFHELSSAGGLTLMIRVFRPKVPGDGHEDQHVKLRSFVLSPAMFSIRSLKKNPTNYWVTWGNVTSFSDAVKFSSWIQITASSGVYSVHHQRTSLKLALLELCGFGAKMNEPESRKQERILEIIFVPWCSKRLERKSEWRSDGTVTCRDLRISQHPHAHIHC